MSNYRWSDDELDSTIHLINGWIGNFAYKFNRARGLVARLQDAIAQDCKLAIDSASARKLKRDARELRRLAGKLDRAVYRLTRE